MARIPSFARPLAPRGQARILQQSTVPGEPAHRNGALGQPRLRREVVADSLEPLVLSRSLEKRLQAQFTAERSLLLAVCPERDESAGGPGWQKTLGDRCAAHFAAG